MVVIVLLRLPAFSSLTSLLMWYLNVLFLISHPELHTASGSDEKACASVGSAPAVGVECFFSFCEVEATNNDVKYWDSFRRETKTI